MLKTILFDLDGTLVNTIGGIAWSCNSILEKYHYPTHLVKEYHDFVGSGLEVTLKMALPKDWQDSSRNISIEKLKDEFMAFYKDNPMVDTRIYDGIYEVLDGLKERGIRWGIHTNKRDYIAQMIADQLFKAYEYIGLEGSSETVPHKPRIEGALKLIGNKYDPKEVVFVGDSEVDFETAKNLGVEPILVSWGFRSQEQLASLNAKYMAHTPVELMEIIDKIHQEG